MTGSRRPESYVLPVVGEVSAEAARQIQRAISEQDTAHRKAWEEQQRADGQIWVFTYDRFRSRYTEEYFTEDDALGSLEYAGQNGECFPVSVTCPDGRVIKQDDTEEGFR